MKKMFELMAVALLVAGTAACDDFGKYPSADTHGELQWEMDKAAVAKAGSAVPEINDFLLTITDSKGVTLFDGAFGDSPLKITVPAGSYTFKVVSGTFTTPAFDNPVYGDEQVVVVESGQSVNVVLNCTLLNCGIKLNIASDFLTTFPNGVMFVKQESAKLVYAYREKRVAYFHPGDVSVVLNNGGTEETLFTRTLQARQVLTVNISAPGKTTSDVTSSVSVTVDTSKTWLTDKWIIGGDNSGGGSGGGSVPDACSVAEAKDKIGQKDIWVYGYIVGGDLTTSASGEVKTADITKTTHIALADRSSVTDKTKCIAVELPAGKVREALNLVQHPDLVKTRVYVKGEIVEKYFGTLGMKGTSDYVRK